VKQEKETNGMFEVRAGKETIAVSAARVARVADRLWRMPQAKRDHALAEAKERLGGPRPTKRDAAIAALAR
jgi:hypothetical protein